MSTEEERLESKLKHAKGLVFDCDGTLIDTMPIYYLSWDRTCKDVGLDFSLEQFYKFAGRPVKDIFETLISEQKPNMRDIGNGTKQEITANFCEKLKRHHHEMIEKKEKIFAPSIHVVVNIVKKYHGKIPMAVASSGWRDHVIKGLERVGILDLFDAVVTADEPEVKNPKPFPDIFLEAAKRIGIDPSECVGFEDADLGMAAIQSANYLYACDVRRLEGYPNPLLKNKL